MMTGPYALVLRFRASRPLGKLTPERIHAAFLGLVQSGDPSLAKLLHSPGMGRRPFSLAPLGHMEGNETLSLRLGVIAPELFARFWERWNKRGGFPLQIGKAKLPPIASRQDGPWAGTVDWGKFGAGKSARTIQFHFCTPTAFRQGDLDLPLPAPRLIFRGLLTRWNAFAPIPLPLDGETIDRSVALSSARIETRVFYDGRAHIPGFVGPVEFRILRRAPKEAVRALHALAEFAFYAGVGRKTTHGMGLVKKMR